MPLRSAWWLSYIKGSYRVHLDRSTFRRRLLLALEEFAGAVAARAACILYLTDPAFDSDIRSDARGSSWGVNLETLRRDSDVDPTSDRSPEDWSCSSQGNCRTRSSRRVDGGSLCPAGTSAYRERSRPLGALCGRGVAYLLGGVGLTSLARHWHRVALMACLLRLRKYIFFPILIIWKARRIQQRAGRPSRRRSANMQWQLRMQRQQYCFIE